ncbi:MAG: TIGR03016 family PEP-CTERM system-associated outer membrane protein [Pseudomonadota bacterium]|nr:TIGR03016 family PEP-CTERM system-associated outer membrane protein [Pseudomonadota bacterium]
MVAITMKVPENKNRRRALFPAVYSAATAMLLLSSYSYGQAQPQLAPSLLAPSLLTQPQLGQQGRDIPAEAGWRILPRLNLRETYTDNVRLRSEEDARGDFVTQVNPGISIVGTGPRFVMNANYTMNNLFYAEQSNLTRTRHQLNATATGELIQNLFFVDGRATSAQQNVSLLGAQAIDNVNVTGNRADIRTYTVSPYLRHRFKDFASTELRYTHGIVESSANGLRNSQRDGYQFALNSGEAFRTLNWGVNYSNQMIHFDRSDRTIELERSTANLRYLVTPQFGLTATGGYERNSFISIRGNPSSPTWTAGFTWQPSERTSVVANAGQRFFGDTYFAEARHRTRLTAWNLSYIEDITTFNQQAGLGSSVNTAGSLNQLLNPGASPGNIQPNTDFFLGQGLSGDPLNFLTNRLFLQKRLQASVAMNGVRNTLFFRVFNMSRQAYTAEDVDLDLVGAGNLALLRHTKQTGASALWSYRISQRTTTNLSAQFTRFRFLSTDRVDDLKIIRLNVTRQLHQAQPNLNGMIELRHNQRDSSQAGADYRENAITASLNMSF